MTPTPAAVAALPKGDFTLDKDRLPGGGYAYSLNGKNISKERYDALLAAIIAKQRAIR